MVLFLKRWGFFFNCQILIDYNSSISQKQGKKSRKYLERHKQKDKWGNKYKKKQKLRDKYRVINTEG